MIEKREKLSAENAFSQQFDSQMLRQRTIMIGQIVSFDATENSISVQPVLQRQFIDSNSPSNLPIINNVPVSFFGAGGFWITVTPVSGDYCILMVSDRCLDLWKQTGGIVSPVKPRHHDITDCVAYVGLNPFNDTIPSIEPAAIHVRSKDGLAGVKVKDDKIELIQGGLTIGTVTSTIVAFTVNVTAPDFITDSGISLKDHTHTGNLGNPTSEPN